MSMPVIVKAGFELEPLAGEAHVERSGRAGDGLDGAEGLIDHAPHDRGCIVGHRDGAVEMVGVDEVDDR